jgi:hypothetical protein
VVLLADLASGGAIGTAPKRKKGRKLGKRKELFDRHRSSAGRSR